MKAYLAGAISFVLLGGQSPALADASADGASEQAAASGGAERTGTATLSALEEVVVTATRREERLQDVPISLTAFSQQDLEIKGIVGYEGLALQTPGVVLNRQTANFNNFTARGIATNGYGANLQSTVAIYIDELPISRIGNTTTLDPNLYDVERVEFLRGPQGTLFGSGSLAGAVRILNKNPDLTKFDAAASVDFGQTDSDTLRQRYKGMVNLPLIDDKLALRLVGFYRDEGGYVDNVGTGKDNSNALVDAGGRGIILWEPTDRLRLRGMISYEDSKPEDSSLVNLSLGRDKRNSDRPDLFTGKSTIYNFTFEYQFEGATFTSSSTYSEFDQKFFVDLAATFGGGIPFALDALAYQNDFVEEARLASDLGGKFDYVLGVFYLDRRLDVDYNYRSSPEYLAANGMTGLPDEYYMRFGIHVPEHELAGFGELTYRFTDDFWVTGGFRYGSNDAQAFTEPGGYTSNYLINAIFGIDGPLTVTPVPEATGVKADASRWSYKLSASYKPAPDVTTYGTISTGFRTPVVNARAGQPSAIDPNDIIIPFGADSDDLINFELGVKGVWLDGKLAANVAAYWIDWSNIQVQANRVSDSVQFATNIGEARSKGIEFEISSTPVEGLEINLHASMNDAHVTELTEEEAAISGAVEDARLAFPKFEGAAFVKYGFDLGSDNRGFVTASVQHVDSYPNMFPRVPGKPEQVSPTFDYTESFNNFNLTFGAEVGQQLTVTAYVENVLGDDSINYVHPEAFLASRYGVLRPRTIGMRLDYRL